MNRVPRVTLPRSALVAMMDVFGRHEFGVGGAGCGLDPRPGGIDSVDVRRSIIAPLSLLAQADPAGFTMALRDAVLPVGGWPVYGASRALPELLGNESAHPARDEIRDAALALLREWGGPPYFPPPRPKLPEVDLAELAEIAAAVAAPPEGTDLAEVTGLLGVALLQWYDQDGDPDTLSGAIGHLHDAAALDPDHADRVLWYESLSAGYGERASRAGRLEDHDAAVRWTTAALAELGPDDPDFDPLNVALAEYGFDRFYARRSGQEWDEPTARAEAEQLVSGLEPLTAGDPEAASYLRMLLGMGYLERFGVTETARDLDRGIPLLEAALSELPPDTPRRPAAGPELVDAYRHRFEVTGDRESLDRAIAIAADLIGAGDPGQPEWAMLHQSQAEAYERRWHIAAEDPADLDRAIDSWQVVWDVLAEAYAPLSRGILLAERAQLATPPAASDLAEAAQGMELALRHDDYPEDVLLSIHGNRIQIMLAQTRQPEGAPDAGERRRLVDEANAALAAARTAPLDLRALLAGVLALGEFAVAGAQLDRFDRGLGDATLAGLDERVRELLALAAKLPDPPPEWQAVLDYCWGNLELLATGTGGDPGEAAERFARAAELIGPELGSAAVAMAQVHSMETGDRRGYRAAAGRLSQPAGSAEEHQPEQQFFVYATSALYRAQHGDVAALRGAAPRVASMLEQLPESRTRDMLAVPMAQLIQQLAVPGSGGPAGGPAVTLSGVPAGGPLSAPVMGGRVMSALGRLLSATTGDDPAELGRCAAELDALASEPMPAQWVRFVASWSAGLAYLEVARRDGSSRSAAERAVRWCEEAAAAAGGPQHPLWSATAVNLAESLRLAGSPDRARTRELGMSALQSHAWQVLRQAGTDYALDAARDSAAADMYKVARWCLEDRATGELVAVLDIGRSLVLNAATASRGVADQLSELGHHDLAEDWQATAGLGRDRLTGEILTSAGGEQIPDDLRLKALGALQPEVLEPVRVSEIQDGLSRLGTDALVYLVPDRHGPGVAVVVPVAGLVETVPLPNLTTGPGSPLSRYAGPAHGARDLGPAGTRSGPLDDLCAWAWQAAMGPLTEHVQRWQLNRPARLVLVPMGMLGLVPWHAAFTVRGTSRRYAVEDLVISYSPSARMMCRAARRPDRPIRSALVVGNPSGDLPAAGAEARAIHRRFYPDSAYLGQPAADGEGTPEEVMAWIAHAAPGPLLLHFACHGRVDAGKPADAHLVLAHGRPLAARDLLDASRLATLEMDTVYLAACTTHVGGNDYDEVLSLATGVLAAGARTVFGSLWRVPDEATSLLMYLVHHHITIDGCAPAEALHRAQLWMLNPARQPPDGMPQELARLCSHPDAADPVSWAAFTHLGR
jgi:hypothetical protein